METPWAPWLLVAVTPSATTSQLLGRHPDTGTFPGQNLAWESSTKRAEMGLSTAGTREGLEQVLAALSAAAEKL